MSKINLIVESAYIVKNEETGEAEKISVSLVDPAGEYVDGELVIFVPMDTRVVIGAEWTIYM